MSPTKSQLNNGLKVATDFMPGIETASISVLVKAGSRHENSENSGISHFLEHMAFKGTKSRTAKQIAEEFDDLGGHFNAYTSREKTVYYAKVLKNDVDRATEILADILQNSTYDPKEIDKERDVILEEIKMVHDTPDDLVFEHFQDAAYPEQPFGRSILGTPEILAKINRFNIVQYVNDHYSAENIIISGAGNLKSTEFENIVKEKFKNFPAHSIRNDEKANYVGGDVRIKKKLEQVQLVIGFKGVNYTDPDYYTQHILSSIAGGGMSSRLFQEVREKRGLCYSISAFASTYTDSGIFGVYAGTSQTSANELIETTADELLKLTSKITKEELQRAKTQLRSSLLMSQESTISRSEKLAGNIAIFDRYIPIEEIIEQIDSIKILDVQKFAKKVFSSDSLPTIASLGNISKLKEYDQITSKFRI